MSVLFEKLPNRGQYEVPGSTEEGPEDQSWE